MRTFATATAMLLAAACSEPAPENATSTDAEAQAPMPVEPDSGIGDTAGPLPAPADGSIPAALHGRWGLVPADCTSTRGDAKGLLTIGPRDLKFYESRGVLDQVQPPKAGEFQASYAFTGEGMEWSREIAFARGPDDNTLILRETGENAEPPLTYTRCN